MKSKRTRSKVQAAKPEPPRPEDDAPPAALVGLTASRRASARNKVEEVVKPVKKVVKAKDTKNNRKPPAKAAKAVKVVKNTPPPKGRKTGKANVKDPKVEQGEEVTEKVKEENTTPNEKEEKVVVNTPKGKGRPAKKDKQNVAATTKEKVVAPKEEVVGAPDAPGADPVKEEREVKAEQPPQPAEKTEKPNAVPTRTSARGRKPKTIVDPSDDVGSVSKRAGKGKGVNKKGGAGVGGKKRKSVSGKATTGVVVEGEKEIKTKVAKKAASKKAAAAASNKTTALLVTSQDPSLPAPSAAVITVPNRPLKGATHVIEEQVVSPQILDAGSLAAAGVTPGGVVAVAAAAGATTNGGAITVASAPAGGLPTDLLLSETLSSPHRFTKMITQPSQELPAEIFQNEQQQQTISVTSSASSPQKSPRVLKLVLSAQGTLGGATLQPHGISMATTGSGGGGLNTRGPAVIVRQNSAAGDAGIPDHITCLNVNGSATVRRRSVTTDSNGENGAGPSTSDARPGGDSEDTAVRFYNPSSPGKLVGEGLHNYCKSPLLAPAGTFPVSSPTSSKAAAQSKAASHSEATPTTAASAEKKSRKRSVSSGLLGAGGAGDAPVEKATKKALATPPPPPPPSASAVNHPGTRRSSRGNAGKPPKRESMVEIPIVNRRRATSTNLS